MKLTRLGLGLGLGFGARVRPTVTAACAAGARHRIVPSCASEAAEVAAVKRAASATV